MNQTHHVTFGRAIHLKPAVRFSTPLHVLEVQVAERMCGRREQNYACIWGTGVEKRQQMEDDQKMREVVHLKLFLKFIFSVL